MLSNASWKIWLQDELTDIEKEEIDCAIALSMSEEDHKGKKVIGKLHSLSVLTSYMVQIIWIGHLFRTSIK